MTITIIFVRLLSKNAVVSEKSKVVLLAIDQQARFGEAWAEASSCQEVVEGVLNYISLVMAMRWCSYEAIALLRSLHLVRYFQNVCDNAGCELVTFQLLSLFRGKSAVLNLDSCVL